MDMEPVSIDIIARMRSDFPTKFGIPRQSGLVDQLRSTIVLSLLTAMLTLCGGWRIFPTCGSSGSFQKRSAANGRLRCGRPGWGATPVWASLLPAPLSVPIIWDFPA